jgi:nucleoside-triphosphatase
VDRFERIVVPCLGTALEKKKLIIIDEIGKMELFSERFRQMAAEVLGCDRMVLAVIHEGSDGFTRSLRRLPNLEELTVTEKNRDALPSLIVERMNLSDETRG